MQQYLIINHQSGKPFLMGAEIDLFLEPRLWVSKLISKLETGNWYLRHWIHEKNKLRASMTSVVTSIHNFKQESLFRIKACRGVAFCEAGASLAPLHPSRILYKSTLFMQNKPNFQKAKMNVNIYYTKVYKNETAFRRVKNKPNSNPICSELVEHISKQLVAARPRSPESAKMARKIDVLKLQNIILKKSNFLYPNRLNSLSQHNHPTGTSFAYLEYMR